jgi:hypothetical protein
MARTTKEDVTRELIDHHVRVTGALRALERAFMEPIPRSPAGAKEYYDRLRGRKGDLDEALHDYGLDR